MAPHVVLNAHLLSGDASYRSAGIHGYIYNSLDALAQLDSPFRCTLLLGKGQLPQSVSWTTERSRLDTSKRLTRILWEQTALPFKLAQLQPDLFHGMAFALPAAWRGPAVVTIYDLSFIRYPERLGRLRRLYLTQATRQAVQRASAVLAISESGKTEINRLLRVPIDRIVVARPGVRPQFRPLPAEAINAFRAEYGLPDRFILHVGTLEPRKNLEVLVRAYAQLPHRGDFKLVLVGGTGWQTGPLLELIASLRLTSDILMPGYVSNDSLPMWYNAANLFVYPSVYEGFGMPLVEALACGKPVLASNTTSLPEAVGPMGRLLPAHDVDAWVEGMTAALDQTDDKQHAEARQRWASQFTWEHTARQTLAAYQQALNAS
ncbi:MAG: glycosyltransferase family 4 protein [Chloroflexi bacterium]|nr:glycosyltransferase family 4 protein [Chloroflexota bacterium]